jgi:hypothetical protein
MELTKYNNSEIENQRIVEEFEALCLILDNWCSGYLRLVDEHGCDWSLPHEFFQEFFEQMCPYIDRLHKTGHSRPHLMRSIGEKLLEAMQKIISRCEQEEDLLRLTGQWSDNEQDIKDHWCEEAKKLAAGTILRISQDIRSKRF